MMYGFVLGFLLGLLIELCLFVVFLARELKALDMLKQINNIIGNKLVNYCKVIEKDLNAGNININEADIKLVHIKKLSVIWDEIMNIPCERIAISFKKIIPENFLNEKQMNLINNEI